MSITLQVCASKVYTSAEFKREKDNFQSLCKNLERTETKRFLKRFNTGPCKCQWWSSVMTIVQVVDGDLGDLDEGAGG